MRHPLFSGIAGTPPAPGPTPHSAGRRASGTTQPRAPQYWPARLRHTVLAGAPPARRCPGAEDQPPAPLLRASGTTMRGPRPSAREGGQVMRRGRSHRPRLRTRVLVGVLAVTLGALAAFDIAAVAALRGYLIGRADSQLREVLALYRPMLSLAKGPRPNSIAVRAPGAVPFGRQPNPAAARAPGAVILGRRNPTGRTRVHARCRVVTGPADLTRAKPQPAGAEHVLKNGAVIGPRVQVAAPILDQYYVGFVEHVGHRPATLSGLVKTNGELSGLVGGDPSLTPRLPANLTAVAAARADLTVPGRNGSAQLRLQAVNEAGGTLVATTSLAGVTRTTGQLELILAIGSAAAALLAGLGANLVMRRGLRPIETMAAQADAITAGDLTDRVSPHDTRTEVGRLGAALNGMLARIDAAIGEREASQQA